MVSKAGDDLPEPDRPVKTMSLSRGSSRETLRRLCSRAPWMRRVSATSAHPTDAAQPDGERAFVRPDVHPGSRRRALMPFHNRVIVIGQPCPTLSGLVAVLQICQPGSLR